MNLGVAPAGIGYDGIVKKGAAPSSALIVDKTVSQRAESTSTGNVMAEWWLWSEHDGVYSIL